MLGVLEEKLWQPQNFIDSKLYGRDKFVPSIVHKYDNGNKCTVDEDDPQVDKAYPEKRRSEVWFMCSPDPDMHMIVSEKVTCIYTVEIYLPQLCSLEEMQVHNIEQEESSIVGSETETGDYEEGVIYHGNIDQEDLYQDLGHDEL